MDTESLPELVHNGYFSQDKKGILKDTKGTTAADKDTYGLIMRDKEKLLDFDSKLKFIFSPSALKKDGITLTYFRSVHSMKQNQRSKNFKEIGRGLRISVIGQAFTDWQ